MARNKSLCRECQLRPIEYDTSITGSKVKHGLCRDCYERRAARGQSGAGLALFKSRRTRDMQENTYETKHGPSQR